MSLWTKILCCDIIQMKALFVLDILQNEILMLGRTLTLATVAGVNGPHRSVWSDNSITHLSFNSYWSVYDGMHS